MIKKRKLECEGIYNKKKIKKFNYQDRFLLFLRLPLIYKFIKFGINYGKILEAGCGPGILGLNLLKRINSKSELFGIDISFNMSKYAINNSKHYNFTNRTNFINGDNKTLPFKNNFFDNIISNGSLHHWTKPEKVFNELFRVLKPNGKIFINDLRRNVQPFLIKLLKIILNKFQKEHLDKSLYASYTIQELKTILKKTNIKNYTLKSNLFEMELIIIK